MLYSTGPFRRGEERHAAVPEPEAGVLCLQPQDGKGLKQDPGAAEPIQGDQNSNRLDPRDA